MTKVNDIPADKLIPAVAEDLKNNIKLKQPAWAGVVKTGAHRERQPDSPDWWWHRAASILRKISLEGPVGVQRLRVIYGGKKNRGHKPEEFRRAGGKIVRTILQEFDRIGFTCKSRIERGLTDKRQLFHGREITDKGKSYLDKIASGLKND